MVNKVSYPSKGSFQSDAPAMRPITIRWRTDSIRWAYHKTVGFRFQLFDWLTDNMGTRKITRVAFRWWRESRFSSSSDFGCTASWRFDSWMNKIQSIADAHTHLHTTELFYAYITNTYKKDLLSYTHLFFLDQPMPFRCGGTFSPWSPSALRHP